MWGSKCRLERALREDNYERVKMKTSRTSDPFHSFSVDKDSMRQ